MGPFQKLPLIVRGVVYIIAGVVLLAFALYLVVDTADIPGHLGVPLYDNVFDAYPALLGLFLIIWGYDTLKSDRER